MRATREEKITHRRTDDPSHRTVDRDVVRSLQSTIRDADVKATTLLGGAGALATALIDLGIGSPAPTTPWAFVLATAATVIICLAMLLKAGWHLLAAVRPRFGRGFACRGSGCDEDARERAAALRIIAVAKHRAIARSIPWLLAAWATAGCAAAVVIVGPLCLLFLKVAN
jgi:hypothetical protein